MLNRINWMESPHTDEEVPIIISVCSLSEKSDSIAMASDDSMSYDSSVIINQKYTTVKNEGKPGNPSAYLKTFKPFEDENIEASPHTVTTPNLYPNVYHSRPSYENITTDSMQMYFKPRVVQAPYIRPRLSLAPQRYPTIRQMSPGINTGKTRPPLAPHEILQRSPKTVPQSNFQTTHQILNTSPSYRMKFESHTPASIRPVIKQDIMQYSQDLPPARSKPPAPHELTGINSDNLFQPLRYSTPPLYGTEHSWSRSHTQSVPIRAQISPALHQRTHAKAASQGKPLPPHELLKTNIEQQNTLPKKLFETPQTTQQISSYQGADIQPHNVEQQIIDLLETCEFESALKISKAINQPMKLVLDILTQLSEQSIVIIKKDIAPNLYILYDNYQNNYSAQKPTHSHSTKRPLSQTECNVYSNSKRIDTSSKEFNMDPVSLLAHHCNKARIPLSYRVVSSIHRGSRVEFVMEAVVGQSVYSAVGPNKKEAKKDASDLALKDMLVQGMLHENTFY